MGLLAQKLAILQPFQDKCQKVEISLGLENAQNLAKILHFGAGKATASAKACQDVAFNY